MDRPVYESPVTVPVPELKDSIDIRVYTNPETVPTAYGTSLNGTRSVADFLALLKMIITPDDFHLQSFKDGPGDDIDSETEGTISAGEYIIAGPSKTYGHISLSTFKRELDVLHGASPDKKPRLSTIDAVRSQRDTSNSKEDSEFKSRLIARDKGCIVCMAQQQDDAMYLPQVDSEIFIGTHIFPLQYFELWEKKGRSGIVTDPHSVPSRDIHRMNSIDNGILLCIQHHIEFNAYLFSIHPDTHIVTSFHLRTKSINGLTIKQPWARTDCTRYPPPHAVILRDHFHASIARWMMMASDEEDEEDTLEDDEIAEVVEQ